MKKHILWILPLVVSVLVVILYQLPHVYRFWFNVRHVLLYGLGAYTLMGLLFSASRILTRSPRISGPLKLGVQGVFGAGFIAGLLILGNLQMRYIELYEVPPLKQCVYYDEHGNLLFASQYPGSCFELEEVGRTEEAGTEVRSFSIEETFSGPGRSVSSIDEEIAVSEYSLDASLNVDVTITYMDKNHIESVEVFAREQQHRTNNHDNAESTIGNTWYKHVKNEVDGSAVTVTTTSGEHSFDSDGHVDVAFPSREEISTQEVVLSSLKYDKDEIAAYIDISRTETTDGVETTELFLTGEHRDVNGPLFMLDFYEDERFNGSTLDAYFEYGTVTFANKVEKRQAAGVDRPEEYREVSFIQTPRIFYGYTWETSDPFVLSAFEADLGPSFDAWRTDYAVDYLETGGSLYSLKDDTTSKIIMTDYGYKVEDYSTRRYSNGSYYPSLEPENVHQVSIFDTPSSTSIPKMYDYEDMLYHPGRLSDHHFYQHNYLLEGHFLFSKD